MTQRLEIDVAVGVIINDRQQICIAKRADEVAQGGVWEFPGGKIEQYESACDALARELNEELGILVHTAEPLLQVWHDYVERCVLLHVYVVTAFDGVPVGMEKQPIRWVDYNALRHYPFPGANMAILAAIESSQLFCSDTAGEKGVAK